MLLVLRSAHHCFLSLQLTVPTLGNKLTTLLTPCPMTTAYPSFPPLEEPASALWRAASRIDRPRLYKTTRRGLAIASNCLIWAVALAVIAARLIKQAAPHVATFLRVLADHIDPDSAPLTPSMTARDLPDTLEFFQARHIDRMPKPKPVVPTDDELAIDADLVDLTKPALMALYGTKSRRFNKEQLIYKIMERRRTNLETGV